MSIVNTALPRDLASKFVAAQISVGMLASPRFKANPYPFYARMRAETPVFCINVPLMKTVWLVTRYEDVLQVLKDDRFANDWSARMPWLLRSGFARPLTRSMLNMDFPDHTRLRTLVHKAFTPRLIEQLRGRIQAVCDELLDRAARKQSCDLVGEYALPLPLTVIADLLGVPKQDRLRFHSWSKELLAASSGITEFARALPAMWLAMRHLRKLFGQRRADPRDDLITALVQAEEAGDKLSEDELLAMVFLLLIAGYETTVHLIAGGTLALLDHPEQRERLQNNPALGPSAIEELLRYTSPLDVSSARYVREGVTLGGVTLPRGELVMAAVGSANHDETQFPCPETLDIAREPNRQLAFGQGAHFCLGAPLARMEGQIAIATLLRRFPDLRLAKARESLRWRKGVAIRGLEQLPVAI